jgi:hypothetical protein
MKEIRWSRISRRTAAMTSLKIKNALGDQAAVGGFSVRDLARSCPKRAAREGAEQDIGGAQDGLIGPLARGFPFDQEPRWRLFSATVTSTCRRLTN